MIWIAVFLIPLASCDESFLPQVTKDFPNLVGVERIKAWMDPSVDPCQNFYMHSCGGFKQRYKDFKSPNGDKSTDVVSLMGRASTLLVQMILKQEKDHLAKSAVENDIFFKTRDYYLSCSKTDVIEKRGFEPIKPMAQNIIEKWSYSGLPTLQIIGDLQAALGVKIFFSGTYSSVQTKSVHDLRLQLVPVQAYNMNLKTILKCFVAYRDKGVISSNLDLVAISADVLKIESRHSNFSTRLNQLNERVKEFQVRVGQFSYETDMDWYIYLNSLKLTDVDYMHLRGGKDSWISEFQYISSLPRETLMYYSLWKLAANHFNKLSEPYYSIWKDEIIPSAAQTNGVGFDAAENLLRQDCIRETGTNLKYLAGHLYVKYAFNETQKGQASEMVDHIFLTLRKRLIDLEWMDLASKTAAIRKLDSIVKIVG